MAGGSGSSLTDVLRAWRLRWKPCKRSWTAGGQGSIRIYPQPSSGSSFIAGEAYVDEQAIKVLEVIPGRRQTPWLKVETPSGKIGYVFGGQARPPGTTRSVPGR